MSLQLVRLTDRKSIFNENKNKSFDCLQLLSSAFDEKERETQKVQRVF